MAYQDWWSKLRSYHQKLLTVLMKNRTKDRDVPLPSLSPTKKNYSASNSATQFWACTLADYCLHSRLTQGFEKFCWNKLHFILHTWKKSAPYQGTKIFILCFKIQKKQLKFLWNSLRFMAYNVLKSPSTSRKVYLYILNIIRKGDHLVSQKN